MEIELYAWVGEDELGSGKVGLKQGLVPAGMIPLVSTDQTKLDRAHLVEQMQAQANRYGKTIQLVRFVFDAVVQEVIPR